MTATRSPARALATAGLAALLAVLAAGCTKQPEPAGSGGSSAPPTGQSSSAPASPARAAPPATAPIPDSAFFTPPAERTRDAPEKPTDGRADMPSLCDASYPSDKRIGRQRSHHITFYEPNARTDSIPTGTVDHTIAVYQPGGAVAAMAEIRAAVAACPSDDQDAGATLKYRLLTPPSQGDDAILIEETWTPPPSNDPPVPTPSRALISIVRIGDVVTFLDVYGWEGVDADPAVAQEYTSLAVAAIRKWRG